MIDYTDDPRTPTSEVKRVTELFESLYESGHGHSNSIGLVDVLLNRFGYGPEDVLVEVGCGRGHLVRRALDLGVRVTATDVTLRQLDADVQCAWNCRAYPYGVDQLHLLEPASFVTCAGTLPYVPEVYVVDALRQFARLGTRGVGLDIHMRPSPKCPDIELTLHGRAWWLEVLKYVGFTSIYQHELKSNRHAWLTVTAIPPRIT